MCVVCLVARTVTVQRAFSEVCGEGLVSGPPQSRAGIRTLALPDSLVTLLGAHLREWVDGGESALVFTTPTGRPIWRGELEPDGRMGGDCRQGRRAWAALS